MFGTRSGADMYGVAIVDSASAALALYRTGPRPQLIAYTRESLPLENREKGVQRSAVVQALATAGQALLAEIARSKGSPAVSSCYCIIAAPWSRSFAGTAHKKFERPETISDSLIESMAKEAFADQKDIDRATVIEANVSRILLNGYPTIQPAGKHASIVDIFTLASDCDAQVKSGATEAIAKIFPGASIIWRSSARASLQAAKTAGSAENCLSIDLNGEATDLLSIQKGILEERIMLELGYRQILDRFAKGKPPQETMSLMEMIERDECDDEACQALRDSVAKTEPELVQLFGEALAKLTTRRKLAEDVFLVAPPALSPWLARFFARIDFTQFTATTKPFSVQAFRTADLPGVPSAGPTLFADPDLCIALSLVNTERTS